MLERGGLYPNGLKPGDFVQFDDHFGDIYFEVTYCYSGGDFWTITYTQYDKYGKTPRLVSRNAASYVRKVIPAEMAVPVIMFGRQRFQASFGQYDPFYGFAPVGSALRNKGDPF